MVNNKYAITWIDYNATKSMNINLGFSAVTKNYSTCILFIPSEVTTESVNTIVEHEIAVRIHYYYTKLLHLIHTIPHTCSRIQVGS
jgi:hypothetical protein